MTATAGVTINAKPPHPQDDLTSKTFLVVQKERLTEDKNMTKEFREIMKSKHGGNFRHFILETVCTHMIGFYDDKGRFEDQTAFYVGMAFRCIATEKDEKTGLVKFWECYPAEDKAIFTIPGVGRKKRMRKAWKGWKEDKLYIRPSLNRIVSMLPH